MSNLPRHQHKVSSWPAAADAAGKNECSRKNWTSYGTISYAVVGVEALLALDILPESIVPW